MTKAIKISEENYKWLIRIAGNLASEKGEKHSINDALTHLKKEKKSIMDLAGSWSMSDKEAEEIKKSLRKGWASWKIKPF